MWWSGGKFPHILNPALDRGEYQLHTFKIYGEEFAFLLLEICGKESRWRPTFQNIHCKRRLIKTVV
jgi:hypothetical protein